MSKLPKHLTPVNPPPNTAPSAMEQAVCVGKGPGYGWLYTKTPFGTWLKTRLLAPWEFELLTRPKDEK